MNSFSPKLQLKNTEYAIRNKLLDLLTELKGFQFVTTLVLELKKIESDAKSKYSTFYSNSKAGTIIESIYIIFISNIYKFLGTGSGWIFQSGIDHNVNISKYHSLAASNYIKLPKELNHPKNRLIKIQNIGDNKLSKHSCW